MSNIPKSYCAKFTDGFVHTRKKSYIELKLAWRVSNADGEVVALGFASSLAHAEQSARREFNKKIDDYSIPFITRKAPLSAWARHELSLLMSDFGVDNVHELKKEIGRRRREQWNECKLEIVPAKQV